MSRSDGFTVMDVSTDIANDPKFRRVQRRNPAHVAPAFMAYTATLGESWKAGQRVSVADAWPVLLPFDDEIVTSMLEAGLLDSKGFVPAKAWNGWFKAANERREKARERWRRANDKRGNPSTNDSGAPASEPRGSSDDTPVVPLPSVPLRTAPSVPPVPTAPSEDAREVNDPWDSPETEALSWLARHEVPLSETNGLRRKLIVMVERFGVNAVIGKFDRLSAAGVMNGDGAGFVFGAETALFPKADLKALEREDRADDDRDRFNRGVAATQRELARLRGAS